MPPIQTYADIDQLRPLTRAEQKLLDHCKSGEECVLEDGKLPNTETPERHIRAELLRYLILGGCKDFRVQGSGVALIGAYISGHLNLSFEKAYKAPVLFNCHFAEPVFAVLTKFDALSLHGSALPGLNAQGTKVTGDVFLRNIAASGEVTLSGAQIGGQLVCGGATFSVTQGHALNAGRINVSGGVLLHKIKATGVIMLSGAKIGGVLLCEGATFSATQGHALIAQSVNVTGDVFLRNATATGEVSLSGAHIGGQLDCSGATFSALHGHALSLQKTEVRDGFIWRNTSLSKGSLYLASAHVGDLVDDLTSWPEAGRLDLDGFTYDRITAASTDASQRLDWLAKGSTWEGEFSPHPYTQLAKVLREMGHDADARTVLAKREKILHADRRKRWREQSRSARPNYVVALGSDIKSCAHWVWDKVFLNSVIGYGFHPFRSLWWLIALWISATAIAHQAWEEGSFAPNDGPILLSAEWQGFAILEPPANPADLWTAKDAQGRDWESFSSFAYAADLVIPIVEIGQTAAWAPSTERGRWGYHLWWMRWVFTLAGWIVTALGAAAISGIIRRE